jgi:deazaflavin-dependent oxidoreductase (nitroreductase family)
MLKAIAQVLLSVVLVSLAALFALAVWERLVPHRVLRKWWHVSVPMFRSSAGIVPGWVLLETIGRRTGGPRRVPVGGRKKGDIVWLVAAHARKVFYVRNIEANPRVRVRANGRWYEGTASVRPDDNARRRMMWCSPINGLFLLIAATDFVSIRVDLSR